ncbi:MAG: hypothetical protein F2838_06690, partial [Actinobacteria bacterium]|nr:hypothetical protein [Actinomycetota bacterium]
MSRSEPGARAQHRAPESRSSGVGGVVTSIRDWADRVQQRQVVFAFPYAVIKKFGDDGGGRHAALLTYYGFLSVFPLLLLVVATVSTVLQANTALRAQLIDAIVPEQFRSTVNSALLALPSGGVPLIIGVAGLLFGGLGIVFSAYDTLNHLAAVPHRRRLPILHRYLRIMATLVVMIIGVASVGAIAVAVGALTDLPGISRLAAFIATTALTFLVLWTATALLLPHRARLAIIWPAALLGSLAITVVVTFGAVVLPRFVARSGPVYGSFATIVGLFALLFLVSQVLVIAGEVAIVRRRRLWPRALDSNAPTDADRRALLGLAREQERIAGERVEVT